MVPWAALLLDDHLDGRLTVDSSYAHVPARAVGPGTGVGKGRRCMLVASGPDVVALFQLEKGMDWQTISRATFPVGYSIEYRCDLCGAVQDVSTSSLRCYVLEDGETIPCLARVGWCGDCRSLVAMEHIRPLEGLVEYLAHLERDGLNDQDCQEIARLFQEDVGPCVARRIQVFRKAIEWRRRRKSRPRCLKCGSIKVSAVGGDVGDVEDNFEHPGCGGVFRFKSGMHFSEACIQLFSPEGVSRHKTGKLGM